MSEFFLVLKIMDIETCRVLSSLNNNTPYKSALLATVNAIDMKRIKLAGDKLRKNTENMRYFLV